ncbi:MAG: carboxymuconolactone decarboxylase family protein [Nocardiopsaceae bacterium]|nr:carboxymuconolactone decarboxylase family protein [Nocardiopsaceae bacterium]
MTARYTSPAPDEMTDEQRSFYQLFATGRRAQPGSPFSLVDEAGRLQGPPAAWVLTPRVGRALEQVGGAMRYELSLSARAREIAILLVAHHHRSPFELYAHTRAGAAAGLSEEDLGALADGRPPAFTAEEERAAYAVTTRILAAGALDDAEYARAVGVLGAGGLFELVTLVGWYSLVAVQLAVFGLLPPAG